MELLARRLIRDVPDFPKAGIVFKDITPVVQDARAFRQVIDRMKLYADERTPDAIIGIESRGFIFGAPLALAVGCVVALLSALLIGWSLGATVQTLVALAPKSATIPIALPMAERFGGPASLAAVAVAITGIAGTMMAPLLIRLVRSDDPAVQGFALGLTAHAIGTARALQVNPTMGAFSALAMGLNGVATAVVMPLCLAVLPWF